jgi:hypothetical protein
MNALTIVTAAAGAAAVASVVFLVLELSNPYVGLLHAPHADFDWLLQVLAKKPQTRPSLNPSGSIANFATRAGPRAESHLPCFEGRTVHVREADSPFRAAGCLQRVDSAPATVAGVCALPRATLRAARGCRAVEAARVERSQARAAEPARHIRRDCRSRHPQ